MKKPMLAVLALGTALGAGAAHAETYSLSNWLGPTDIMTQEMHVGWADAVREASGGEIDFEVFTGGALMPALSTLQGVADGVAQAGHVVAPYAPSQLPIANLVGDAGAKTPDPFVLAFAYLDYSTTDEAAYQEWRANGIIPGATVSTPTYHYMCRGEVATLADLQGKRVRAPGGLWARFTQHAGMVPVSIPASEIYTSLERGAVDCVAADLTQLTRGSTILELVDSIVMIPLSPAYNVFQIGYNVPFWQGLTDDQRRLLLDQTARPMASSHVVYAREVEAALAAAREQGVAVVDPDPELQSLYDDWVDDGFGGLAEIGRSNLGLEHPEPIIASFQPYIEKWVGLMEGVDRTNVDAVAAVLAANLFDKIDASTFGMD